jgi:hypothetical protein
MRDHDLPPDNDHAGAGIGVCVLITALAIGLVCGWLVGCAPASAGEPINRSGYGFGLTLEQERKLQAIHVSVEMQRELREVNLRRADQLVNCIEEARTPEQLADCTAIRHETAPEQAITEEAPK